MLPSHQWYGIVPGALLFYALIVVAVALFVRRSIYLLRLLLKGKPNAPGQGAARAPAPPVPMEA